MQRGATERTARSGQIMLPTSFTQEGRNMAHHGKTPKSILEMDARVRSGEFGPLFIHYQTPDGQTTHDAVVHQMGKDEFGNQLPVLGFVPYVNYTKRALRAGMKKGGTKKRPKKVVA